jgi:hypothetical protein
MNYSGLSNDFYGLSNNSAIAKIVTRIIHQPTLHTGMNFTAPKIHCANRKNAKEFGVHAYPIQNMNFNEF